jgi:hypothetical protein
MREYGARAREHSKAKMGNKESGFGKGKTINKIEEWGNWTDENCFIL